MSHSLALARASFLLCSEEERTLSHCALPTVPQWCFQQQDEKGKKAEFTTSKKNTLILRSAFRERATGEGS